MADSPLEFVTRGQVSEGEAYHAIGAGPGTGRQDIRRNNRDISQQRQPAGCRQPPTNSAQETVTDAMLKLVTPEQVRAGR